MTKQEFKIKVGREPINDDLERVNCPRAGQLLHRHCGWCHECDLPKFECRPSTHKRR